LKQYRREQPEIGISWPRDDAFSKVTGREKFAADFYGEHFLWGGVKRSHIPHARLIGVNVEPALKIAGVRAALTGRDTPGTNRQGIVKKHQPVLADVKIRRVGEPLALVIADNKEALRQALVAIEIEYEPLPGVFDPLEALQPDAPLIHEDSERGNLMDEIAVTAGDCGEGFKQSEVIIEWEFETSRQEHAYLETEAGWACLEPNNELVVVASTQSPFRDRMEIASALGLEIERVRVIAPYLGGGFGGKDGCNVQCLLALAALKSDGIPVKMWWSREESFLASYKRIPARVTCRLGAMKDGRLNALDCSILMDSGPYEHLGAEVLSLSVEHAGGAYRIPHVNIVGRCVYTNNPMGGPFRGFGAPQTNAVIEQLMEMLAERLSMDPLEVRLKNAARRGDKNALGVRLIHSTGARDCAERLQDHPLWKERDVWKARAGAFKRRGVGIALVSQGAGYGPVIPDVANAKVELTAEGEFRVDCSVSDMGQGNAATFLQIAGDLLNQESSRLIPVLPDTGKTLPSGSSAASRTTYTYARALIKAVNLLKQRLCERASDLLFAPTTDDMALAPGRVVHLPSGREIPLSHLAKFMAPKERVAVAYWRAPMAKDKINITTTTAFLGIPHTLFSYAAHLAYVEVDEITGRVGVERYLSVNDCGRLINPCVFEQQIQGGVAQGLGFALHEEFKSAMGAPQSADFATYIVPTALDCPDMETVSINLFEHTGPYGLKGAGEISINGPLPAVANAVYDACGVRLNKAPLTSERVLKALAENTKG